jgi:hypothetical protein
MVRAFRKTGGTWANQQNYGSENHCFKQHVRPKIPWEGNEHHDLKVINNYLWKIKLRVGMNGKGSLERPKFH